MGDFTCGIGRFMGSYTGALLLDYIFNTFWGMQDYLEVHNLRIYEDSLKKSSYKRAL